MFNVTQLTLKNVYSTYSITKISYNITKGVSGPNYLYGMVFNLIVLFNVQVFSIDHIFFFLDVEDLEV